MIYKLLKHSTYGLEGQYVDLEGNEARQLAVNGVISLDEPVQKVRGPDIVKVEEPDIKKRGRPRKTSCDTA